MTTDQSVTKSLRDVINSNIDSKYFADYGTIIATHGTPVVTVDVQHNAYGFGTTTNTTYNVEVLYPATAGFSMEYPVAVGDGVLLIGLRRYVQTVATPAPVAPIQYASYAKDTLKAIPLSDLQSNSTMYMRSKAGKLQIKNATQSLYTILNNLQLASQTFGTTAAPLFTTLATSVPSGAASFTSLAAAATTMATSLSAVATALAAIMEA